MQTQMCIIALLTFLDLPWLHGLFKQTVKP